MIKDFHFFSRVIVVLDFETVTFYVLFVSSVIERDLALFSMVTFVLSAEPLFSVWNHCVFWNYCFGQKGYCFANENRAHDTARDREPVQSCSALDVMVLFIMIWEVPNMMSCTNNILILNVSGHRESIVKDYQIW